MATVLANVRPVPLDGKRGGTRRCDLLIEGGRITEITPPGRHTGERLRRIEGAGRFALPGLIDCHCHLAGFFLTEPPRLRDLSWIPAQIDLNLRSHLRSGVTTVRDMMAPLRVVLRLRARAQNPRSSWPRIFCSGPMLTVPGGYPAFVPPDVPLLRALIGPLRLELSSRRQARHWVDHLAGAGVDCIKVGYSSRDYDAAGTPLAAPSPELFCAICEQAHHHGLPVAVHHTWLADLKRLLALPFDTLEHLTLDRPLPEKTADLVAERGLPVTTNLEVFAFLDKASEHLEEVEAGRAPLKPAARRSMAQMLGRIARGEAPNPHFDLNALKGAARRMGRNLGRLAERGVLIGAATDAGTNLFFGSLPQEIAHMKRAGLSAAAALRAATCDAARLLGRDDLGRIAPRCRADLVLYEGDPLTDLSVLETPALVLREGVPVAGALC